MIVSSFTPGPWRFKAASAMRELPAEVTAEKMVFGYNRNKIRAGIVCQSGNRDGRHDDQVDADFRLIAAAPEMFAKLEKIVAWLDRLAKQSAKQAKESGFQVIVDAAKADEKNYRKTADDIRKVLAKATGAAK